MVQQEEEKTNQLSHIAKPQTAVLSPASLSMEESNYGVVNQSPPTTRRTNTLHRPGEASRQPIDRPSDVEAGYQRGGAGASRVAGGNTAMLSRKKTLVRPERQRVDPNHRNYHYLQHTQQQNMPVHASRTGNRANVRLEDEYDDDDEETLPYGDGFT